MNGRQYAIVKNIHIGVDDRDRVALMFSTKMIDAGGSDHWLVGDEMLDFIAKAGRADIRQLEGSVILVNVENGIVTIIGPEKT